MSADAPLSTTSELPANRIAALLDPPPLEATPASSAGPVTALQGTSQTPAPAHVETLHEQAANEPATTEDDAHDEAVDSERAAFERNFDRGESIAGWQELLLGFAALAGWFALFTGGTLIATKPYVDAFAGPISPLEAARSGLMIVAFWTISNVGVLSILSAVLGAFGQRTHFTAKITAWQPVVAENQVSAISSREMLAHYASAIMRGFGVYALLLSGLLVMATDAIVTPDQSQYVRLAGTVSVISFYAGYDPEMLAGLLKRIERFLKTE
jgi:hypothetical protein